MKSELIVMLTHNDVTVKNAQEVFNSCKDMEQVKNWGFKNVGLPVDEMKALVQSMKDCGKKTFLEVVTYTEEESLKNAMLAVECGFDCLCGTLFYDSVWEYLKDKPITYEPFIGEVYGSPSVLEGSIYEIVAQAKKLEEKGVKGFDLLAYRYTGDPEILADNCVKNLDAEVVMAGSIDSEDRLNKVNEINPAAFTMGSALFKKMFVPDGDFRENLEKVTQIMDSIQ